MPYSRIDELPDSVRGNLPEHAQEIYKEAYNGAWDQYEEPEDRRGDASREETAHRVAWSAVKQSYEKNDDGKWTRNHNVHLTGYFLSARSASSQAESGCGQSGCSTDRQYKACLERREKMTKLHKAYDEIGQSIWLDYIRRDLLKSGKWRKLIDDGVRGMTSNPSIFAEAIGEGGEYDESLSQMVQEDKSVDEIYEALAIEDIQAAADELWTIYDRSDGGDGFVSLEANPDLAYDTEATLAEARRLFAMVERPNVMIKVPATGAGIPAIAALIGEGININVTLMFSLKHYDDVADAYIRGLERLGASGGDVSQVASVASFFVSRVDTAVDEKLDTIGNTALRSKIGVANAKLAYARYLTIFSSERWQHLEAQGARPQRVLFGSTSVKDPALPETYYVDNLLGANTVNTLPPKTIESFRKGGNVSSGLTADMDGARAQINQLANLGINLETITQQLQDVGVEKFADSFAELKETIGQKCAQLK